MTRIAYDRDAGCLKCRYALRGLSDSANCPECGFGVARSRWGYWLRMRPPGRLLAIEWGLAIVAAAVAYRVALEVMRWFDVNRWLYDHNQWIVWPLLTIGVWLATTAPDATTRSAWSKAIRWTARLGLLLPVAWYGWQQTPIRAPVVGDGWWLSHYVTLCCRQLAALAFVLWLGWLARRMPSPRIGWHVRLFVAALTVCVSITIVARLLPQLFEMTTSYLTISPSSYLGGRTGQGRPTWMSVWSVVAHGMYRASEGWLKIVLMVVGADAATVLAVAAWRLGVERRSARDEAPALPQTEHLPRGPGPWRWTTVRTTAALALVALVPLWWAKGYPAWMEWRTSRAAERLATTPTRGDAEFLRYVLKHRLVDGARGGEALRALGRPNVRTRSGYAAGEPVWLALERPASIDVGNHRFSLAQRLRLKANDHYKTIDEDERVIDLPSRELIEVNLAVNEAGQLVEPTVPGRYTLTLLGEWRVQHPAESPSRGYYGPPIYTANSSEPIGFEVVEPDQADQVALVSNPGLDAAVRASVRVTWNKSGGVPAEQIVIEVEDPPIDLCLRPRFLTDDGIEIAADRGIRVRAGETGRMWLNVYSFEPRRIPAFGNYDGELILEPAEDQARRDPSIEEMWGGEIRVRGRFLNP